MEEETEHKSRTMKKKEAEELQRLGLELSKLSVPQLERIEIPENLRTSLIEEKSITSNIAARRHRQFIGVLMRDVDPASIRKALLQADEEFPAESEAEKQARIWVDKLLTGGHVEMEALLCKIPGLERQRLRQLVRNIKKEKPDVKNSKARKTLEQLILKGKQQ